MCLPIRETQKLLFSAVHSSSRQLSALSTITVSLRFNVDLEPAVHPMPTPYAYALCLHPMPES